MTGPQITAVRIRNVTQWAVKPKGAERLNKINTNGLCSIINEPGDFI